MTQLKLIVGLGNPGKVYEDSRHNLGFCVVKELAREFKIRFKKSLILRSFIAQASIEKRAVILLLPLTFMNNSGSAVKKAIQRKKIGLKNLLVVADDVNLAFGALRIRQRGSSGGHNGLNSIIEALRTEEFSRLRLGVGSANQKQDLKDFVLSGFSKEEDKALKPFIKKAKSCILLWFKQGTDAAMNKFNQR